MNILEQNNYKICQHICIKSKKYEQLFKQLFLFSSYQI